MIKVKDLMVDDLVLVLGELSKVREIHEHGVLLQAKNFYYGEDEIEPIPLTPEILEKNGFNRLEQTASVEPYYWFFFDKETEVKIKAFNTIYRGLWVECVNPVNNATTYKQCEFVHELQHALKLCEIKKEIII